MWRMYTNTGLDSIWSEKISCCKYISIVLGNRVCIYCIYSNARQDFSLIWHSNMWGCLKFMYKAPKHTTPNRITLNRTMQSQTMTCIAKSSCEISALLRYYTALSGNSLPTFRDNLSVPFLRLKKSKTENTAQMKLTDIIFFGTLTTV